MFCVTRHINNNKYWREKCVEYDGPVRELCSGGANRFFRLGRGRVMLGQQLQTRCCFFIRRGRASRHKALPSVVSNKGLVGRQELALSVRDPRMICECAYEIRLHKSSPVEMTNCSRMADYTELSRNYSAERLCSGGFSISFDTIQSKVKFSTESGDCCEVLDHLIHQLKK